MRNNAHVFSALVGDVRYSFFGVCKNGPVPAPQGAKLPRVECACECKKLIL